MNILLSRRFLCTAALLVLALFCWWKFGSDPRSAFLADVEELIASANSGGHLSLQKKLSPEVERMISSYSMSVQQTLFMARKLDTDGGNRYRLAQLSVFYPRDYAEVEIERSGPEGDFSKPRRFPVPFTYEKGEWLVAGGFRGERDFENPFE